MWRVAALPCRTKLCPLLPSASLSHLRDSESVLRAPFPPALSYRRILGLAKVKEHIVHTVAFPFSDEYDDKQPLTSKEEEERRIAEMGRPILGEHTRLEVIIEESYEFKVRLSTPPASPIRLLKVVRCGLCWQEPSGDTGKNVISRTG